MKTSIILRRGVLNYLWSPWRMEYIQGSSDKSKECVFCNKLDPANDQDNLIVVRGARSFVILNKYPYTSGHLMVVPYDHERDLAALSPDCRAEMMELSNQAVQILSDVYHPEAFNLGMNIGKAAGAGVEDHIHMHIVPRWAGDTSFMLTTAGTRVLPEALEDTYRRVKEHWNRRSEPDGPEE